MFASPSRVLPALACMTIASAVSCASVLGIDPVTYDAPDAAADDASSDAPATSDAAPDGGARKTFCTSIVPAPAGCFDFDGDDPLSGWRAGTPTPLVIAAPVAGAAFVVSSTVTKSPPRAMRFDLPGLDADGGTVLTSVQARLPLVALHTHVRLDFDANVLSTAVDPQAKEPVALGGIEMGLSPDPYKIHFYVLPPDLNGTLKVQVGEIGNGVVSGGLANEFHFVTANSGTVGRAVWNHYALDVTFPPAGPDAAARQPVRVVASVTSAATGQTVSTSFQGSAASIAPPILALGGTAVRGAPVFAGVFDNAVLIDLP